MRVIALPARLDSAAAMSLARDLGDALDEDLELDASKVSLFGAHALQTLSIAAAAWRKAGRRFVLTGLSPEAEGQIAELGAARLPLITGEHP